MTFGFPVVLANILGPWQLLIVLAIVLLLFGSSRLPDLMRSLGRSVTEFKKGVNEGSDDDQPDPKKIDKTASS
jgi:sec-independent protein translocase protein TatA